MLSFKSYTALSIPESNPLGLNAGVNILEPEVRAALGTGIVQLHPKGHYNFEYAAKDTGVDYELGSLPTKLPSYVTEGRGGPENRLIPGNDALVTAIRDDVVQWGTKEVEVKKRFWRTEKKRVPVQLSSTKSVVVRFDMQTVDYSTRRAAAFVQLRVEEPKDAEGKKEFAKLEQGLREIGAKAKPAFQLDAVPQDVLIHPTPINTREPNDPAAMRPDALMGVLERTNRVIRGTLPADSQMTFSAEQFVRLMESEVRLSVGAASRKINRPVNQQPSPE